MTEPHPLASREVLWKEPGDVPTFVFDFSESRQVGSATAATVEPGPTVTPSEEMHRIAIGAIVDSSGASAAFQEGESVVTESGATGIVVRDTADGASHLLLYVGRQTELASGVELVGRSSGARTTLSSSKSTATQEAEGVEISSASAAGKLVYVTLRDGLRPVAGAPWREYVVSLQVNWSDGQRLPAIGRVRVPAEAVPYAP